MNTLANQWPEPIANAPAQLYVGSGHPLDLPTIEGHPDDFSYDKLVINLWFAYVSPTCFFERSLKIMAEGEGFEKSLCSVTYCFL